MVGPIGIAHELITALAGSSIDWYYSSQSCIAHKSLSIGSLCQAASDIIRRSWPLSVVRL